MVDTPQNALESSGQQTASPSVPFNTEREAIEAHIALEIQHLSAAAQTPDILELIRTLQGISTRVAHGGSLLGIRAQLLALDPTVDREIHEAEIAKEQHDAEVLHYTQQALERENIEQAYAHVQLSSAAQYRISVRLIPITDETLPSFVASFADPHDSTSLQHFTKDAGLRTFQTPEGKQQIQTYNTLVHEHPIETRKVLEDVEKTKQLVENLLKTHPQGALHEQLTLIQQAHLYRSTEIHDLLGQIAHDGENSELLSKLSHASEAACQHKLDYRKGHGQQVDAVLQAMPESLRQLASHMSSEQLSECANDLKHSDCFAQAQKDFEVMKAGKGDSLSVKAQQRVAALTLDRGLEPALETDDIITQIKNKIHNINATKELSSDASKNSQRITDTAYLSAITDAQLIAKMSHISSEKREENIVALIKSDDKYKGHQWTASEDKQLQSSAKTIIGELDSHKIKFDKIDTSDALTRGLKSVLQQDTASIDSYADAVNQALKQSGYKTWIADKVSGGLRTVGHVYATIVPTEAAHIIADTMHVINHPLDTLAEKSKSASDAIGHVWDSVMGNKPAAPTHSPEQNQHDDIKNILTGLKTDSLEKLVVKDAKGKAHQLFQLTGDAEKDIKMIQSVLAEAHVDLTAYDTDKNGHLSAGEIGTALRQAGFNLHAVEVSQPAAPAKTAAQSHAVSGNGR